MNNYSILISIFNAVNEIKWKNDLQKEKAHSLCASIFNLYRIHNQTFSTFQSLSNIYFQILLPSKRDIGIKNVLVKHKILECDNKYNVRKGIGKGYRFKQTFFNQKNYYSSVQTFTFSTSNSFRGLTISYLSPHEDDCKYNASNSTVLNNYICENLRNLSFKIGIDAFIKKLSSEKSQQILVGQSITDTHVYINYTKQELRYSLPNALKFAAEQNKELIQFNGKCYVDERVNFIEQKAKQLEICYGQTVFNIKHGLFYCDRNDTNNRLDYNLTGFKKELFDFLLLDGEKLVELDIANAQFAIAAHLNKDIDLNFVENAKNGTLYSYVESSLNLHPKEGKQLMFRVAFDKIKQSEESKQVRRLFPKYMEWADGYKRQFEYKGFANLLQKKESEIMIDGLLTALINRGYKVFTIHDALRVKESQFEEIKDFVLEYFKSIKFECCLR